MKTILYATDFSENSVSALKYAYAMSSKIGTQLFVIHVFDIPTTLSSGLDEPLIYVENDYFELNQTRIKEFVVDHLGEEIDKKRIKMEAIEDVSVVNGIISKAKELDTFLIVTGMKGKSAFAEILMGNTTKKLIEKAPFPVLAIPENVTKLKIKTMVYASDFEEEDLNGIQIMINIANSFNAKIHVVHFTTKNKSSANERMEWFKDLLKQKVDYANLEFSVFISQNIYESLQIYSESLNADIIGMLERTKNGFVQNIFHRDLVKKMANYGRKPLLSFNEKNFASKADMISMIL